MLLTLFIRPSPTKQNMRPFQCEYSGTDVKFRLGLFLLHLPLHSSRDVRVLINLWGKFKGEVISDQFYAAEISVNANLAESLKDFA